MDTSRLTLLALAWFNNTVRPHVAHTHSVMCSYLCHKATMQSVACRLCIINGSRHVQLCNFFILQFLIPPHSFVEFPIDIEAQILEIQGMKATLLEEGEQGVGLDSTGFYDQEIYGGSDSRFAGYVTSIAANEQEDVSIYQPSTCTHLWCFFTSPLSHVFTVYWIPCFYSVWIG